MENQAKWRKKADELLAAPNPPKRKLTSVAGKVEDRFEAVLAARQRGKCWADISIALADSEPLKAATVENAFNRLCRENSIEPPGKTGSLKSKKAASLDNQRLPDAAPLRPPATTHTSGEVEEATPVIAGPATSGDGVSETTDCSTSATGSDLFGARWVDDGE